MQSLTYLFFGPIHKNLNGKSDIHLLEVKGGDLMKVFVKFEVFNTITGADEVGRLRKAVETQAKKIMASGKVTASGIFADARAGFFFLDVASAEELFELLGSGVLDHCHVETHPVISFEKLAEFFKKDASG
jgi:hypothetical protein